MGFLDKFLNFTISKKLTVFMLGSIFLYLSKLDSAEWVNLAMVYIGTQGAIDLIKQIRQ